MNEIVRNQRLLACLGDRSRFRVVEELARGEQCVTDLAFQVGLSQSCTTRHLQALLREGIVLSRRMGKRVLFSISPEPRVAALLAWAIVPSTAPRRERPSPALQVVGSIGGDPSTRRRPAPGPRSDSGRPHGFSAAPSASEGSSAEPAPVARSRSEELEDFLL